MPKACFVVRAVVPDAADRPAFDRWYSDEHLPDAIKAFGAVSAWRGWSETDSSIHWAHYEFESLERLNAVMSGPALKAMVAEFDRCWGNKVTRTREIMSVADEKRGGGG
jgi:hypothetical protein